MKTTYLMTVPCCDICKKITVPIVDVPTIHGSWAYLCQGCRPKYEAPEAERVGSRIEKWVPRAKAQSPKSTPGNIRQYYQQIVDCGGKMVNIRNIAGHYLYGTRPEVLARLSLQGIVPSPPGH